MATIYVAFDSEEQAQRAVERLADANLGEVRTRIISSSEPLSFDKTENTAPMMTPGMGTIEVRPTETPRVPEQQQEHTREPASANIPTTGDRAGGVQVMIEFDEPHEEAVRKILAED